ncbi:hypothetical protein C9374_012153 [Naegleria lovaniensis]|uniref:RGS domain-containing protein n=1 Tax=Naegleria lovaniensis TaxID=51637 RepID=A0AA88KE18_NAELO|nr:uncharacterized protein C9374_012153 [Naegleria lovaniensis]KAG2373414.1 hypothetical protein C9374_012153 [Naegleria lovaniensis]
MNQWWVSCNLSLPNLYFPFIQHHFLLRHFISFRISVPPTVSSQTNNNNNYNSTTTTPCTSLHPISLTVPIPFLYWSKSDFNTRSSSEFFEKSCLIESEMRLTSSWSSSRWTLNDYFENRLDDQVVNFHIVDEFTMFQIFNATSLWNDPSHSNKPLNFQLIAQLTRKSDLFLMSRKEKNITNYLQLKDRTIAVCEEHVSHLNFELSRNGMSLTRDVKLKIVSTIDDMYLKVLDDSIDAYFVNDMYIFTGVRKTPTSLYYPREFNIIPTLFSISNYNTSEINPLTPTHAQQEIFRYGILVRNHPTMDSQKFESIIKRFLISQIEMYAYCRENPSECFEKWVIYDYMIDNVNSMIWPSKNGFGVIDSSQLDTSMNIFSYDFPLLANKNSTFRKTFIEKFVNTSYINQIYQDGCYMVGNSTHKCQFSTTVGLNVTALQYQSVIPQFCEDFVFPYPLSCIRGYLYYRLYCGFIPFIIGAAVNVLCILGIPFVCTELIIRNRFIAPYVTPICFTGFLIFSAIVFCRFVTFPEHVAYGLASFCICVVIVTHAMNIIRYFYVRNLFKIMKKSKRQQDQGRFGSYASNMTNNAQSNLDISARKIRIHRIVSSRPVFVTIWIMVVCILPPSFFIAQYFSPSNYVIRNGILLILYFVVTLFMVLCFIFDAIINRKRLRKRGFVSFLVFDDPLLYRMELMLCSLELISILWASLSDYYVYNVAAFTSQAIGFTLMGVTGSLTWSYGFSILVLLYRKCKRTLASAVGRRRRSSVMSAISDTSGAGTSSNSDKHDHLERLMNNDDFYSLLEDYCKKEFSSENLYLYTKLLQIKKRKKYSLNELLFIYENYIKNYAPYEVNVSFNTKKAIRETLEAHNVLLSHQSKDLSQTAMKFVPSLEDPLRYNTFDGNHNSLDQGTPTTPYRSFDNVDVDSKTPPSASVERRPTIGSAYTPTPPKSFGSGFKNSFRKLGSTSSMFDEDMEPNANHLVGMDDVELSPSSNQNSVSFLGFETIEPLFNDVTQNIMDTFSRLCDTTEYQQWESLNSMTTFGSDVRL